MFKFGCCLPGGSFMPQGVGEIPDSVRNVMTEGSAKIVGTGYSYAEVGAGFLAKLTDGEMQELIKEKEKGKLPIEAVNSFIPAELKIFDSDNQEKLRRYVKTILCRASRLKIDTMVFGSGTARNIPAGMSRKQGVEGIKDFLRMCNEYALKYGVTVAIEPLNRTECNILNTVGEGAEMVRELNLPGIRLIADAFHMYAEDEDFSVLQREKDIIVHIHVSEPPNRLYPGRDGGEYLRQFASALKATGYEGRISVECKFLDFGQEIKPALEFLKEAF